MSEQERQKSSLSPTEEDELIEITTHLKNERALAEQGKPNQSEDYRSLLNALVYRLIQQGAPDEVLSEVRDHECTRFELRAITEDRDALAAELAAVRESRDVMSECHRINVAKRDSRIKSLYSQLAASRKQPIVGVVDENEDGLFADLETPEGVLVKWGDRLYAHPVPARELTNAADSVLAERRRQIEAEGYSPAHDDEHVCDEIAALACFYAMPPGVREWSAPDGYGVTLGCAVRPCGWEAKTGDRRDELVKAGALVLAEIERIDRAHIASKEKK